jgi:predicted DNA-binding transcriptional regulator AlpA
METPILFPVDPNEFYQHLTEIVRKIILETRPATPLVQPPLGLMKKPLLSIKEVRDLFDISRPTVDEWHELGELKKVKIRGKVYFLTDDIHRLIENSKSKDGS